MFFLLEKGVYMTLEYLSSPDFMLRAGICLLFIISYTYCITRSWIYTFNLLHTKILPSFSLGRIFYFRYPLRFHSVCNSSTLYAFRIVVLRLYRVHPGSCNSCNSLVLRGLARYIVPCSGNNRRAWCSGALCPFCSSDIRFYSFLVPPFLVVSFPSGVSLYGQLSL